MGKEREIYLGGVGNQTSLYETLKELVKEANIVVIIVMFTSFINSNIFLYNFE